MNEHRKLDKTSIMERAYDPKEVEQDWYEYWESGGYFEPKGVGERFCIVIPPPNVTGNLHIGHALNLGLHDVVIRYKRMLGFDTLWLPGVDHAGIATQTVVERKLLEQGIKREELGREKFLEEVWKWKESAYDNITNQMRAMGFSVDWKRERFTLDPGLARAVREVFVRLYEKGWIYRGTYMVNWCPTCKTVLSDLEVDHEDVEGGLYDITYPYEDGDGKEGITVATTRPETMLADTAIAVNPADERYRDKTGKNVILPLMNKPIPIIADDYVDIAFGTGALKITPAHDPNDYEVGLRHNLDAPIAIGKDGNISDIHPKYQGMDRFTARKAILDDLKKLGLLGKTEKFTHAVGHHDRCKNEIEPFISTQWFVKMDEYVKPAMEIVRDGRLKLISERWTKVYLDWLENIRDWCISRQLWWGHRIPAFYCDACSAVIVEREDPTECPKCGSTSLTQDEDVLDTWFSSALWPFSTMGWPDETEDLKKYYPTDLLITGYDIIFFWVARMAWSAMEFMGDVPFHECFIHGLLRDEHGKKMSKSTGNAVDPLETVDEFGRDTLRFTLTSLTFRGKQDISLGKDKLQSSRFFMNKVWNAAKFVLMNLEKPFDAEKLDQIEDEIKGLKKGGQLDLMHEYILDRYYTAVKKATNELDRYNFGEYASTLYQFFWDEFCGWYIECSKTPLRTGGASKKHARAILQMILMRMLQILHPAMPFITEEIWHEFPGEYKPLIVGNWPKVMEKCIDEKAQVKFEKIKAVVSAIRSLRKDIGLKDSVEVRISVRATDDNLHTLLISQNTMIRDLTKLQSLEMLPESSDDPENSVSLELDDGTDDKPSTIVFLLIDDPLVLETQIQRLEKEEAKIGKYVESLKGKLENPSFVDKAPANVIDAEKAKLAKSEGELNFVRERLQKMRGLLG
ncbi:MAG: valine--tRNA ligase [bacterium]